MVRWKRVREFRKSSGSIGLAAHAHKVNFRDKKVRLRGTLSVYSEEALNMHENISVQRKEFSGVVIGGESHTCEVVLLARDHLDVE